MQENFTIAIPNSLNFPKLPKVLSSILISLIIVYFSIGLSSMPSILSCILLFILFYVILDSMNNDNLANELPSTLYPSLPHLGLDGISLNSYVAGLSPQRYV